MLSLNDVLSALDSWLESHHQALCLEIDNQSVTLHKRADVIEIQALLSLTIQQCPDPTRLFQLSEAGMGHFHGQLALDEQDQYCLLDWLRFTETQPHDPSSLICRIESLINQQQSWLAMLEDQQRPALSQARKNLLPLSLTQQVTPFSFP